MLNRIVIGALLFSLIGIFVACAGPDSMLEPPPTPSSALTPTPTQEQPSVLAGLQLTDLAIDPAEINPGEEVLVTATITNVSDAEKSYSAELSINDATEAVKEVVLPAGGTELLSFSVSKDITGNYRVILGDLSGQFVVIKPVDLTPTSDTEITASEFTIARDFTSMDVVTSEIVSLSQFRGSVVLINFVNYGCSTSLNQIVSAQLSVIRDLRKQRQDFVPISIFCGCCPAEGLREFAEQNDLIWPWILDTDNSIIPLYTDYLTEYGYPTLILIDKDQHIREATGYSDFFTLDRAIEEISRY